MASSKKTGNQSILFANPPIITGWASVGAKKESEGPLGRYLDVTTDKSEYGGDNWEEAESRMQYTAVSTAIKKSLKNKKDIDYIVAGDLLGQLMATSFGIKQLDIPLFGVYGACSTMGEAISVGSILVDGGYAENVAAMTSSHFATAEKQFRFPLGYGNQRPKCATTTVTGSGAVIISSGKDLDPEDSYVQITGITTGKITDYGIKDANNMGAAMAPAAYDVIKNNLNDFGYKADEYDQIITGDLGEVGKNILLDMLSVDNIKICDRYMDCGIEIYDNKKQDVHSGGSGCGCSALVLCGYIMNKLRSGEWGKVLFIPTGALLSAVSAHEGNTIPSIAHGVILQS